MTQKWSSKPKHDRAARVRENQRRHRAKAKTYVAELENQVADLKSRLNEVLEHNAQLVSEVDKLRDLFERGPRMVGRYRVNGQGWNMENEELSPSQPLPPPIITEEDQHASTSSTHIENLGQVSPHISPDTTQPTPSDLVVGTPVAARLYSPIQSCITTPTSRSNEHLHAPGVNLSDYIPSCLELCSSENTTKSISVSIPNIATSDNIDLASLRARFTHLPPPAPGESTIPCETAYGIISQQNYAGQDLSTISRLLRPGFRRAVLEGDDCRVMSSFVFAVIDAISSS